VVQASEDQIKVRISTLQKKRSQMEKDLEALKEAVAILDREEIDELNLTKKEREELNAKKLR